MIDKLEAGRRVAAPLITTEEFLQQATASNLALRMAVMSARCSFDLPAGVFENLMADLEATRIALSAARRSVRRVHEQILTVRADEGMGELPFGCPGSCTGAALAPTPELLQLAG